MTKKGDMVRCASCGAIFYNRRFWALPKNDPMPRSRCPRCFRKGPFQVATLDDARRQAKDRARATSFIWTLEVAGGVVLLVLTIWKVWRG